MCDCTSQLSARRVPLESRCISCLNVLACPNSNTWLVKKPDTCFVQIEHQPRPADWDVAAQKLEPLPDSEGLAQEKVKKRGSIFWTPTLLSFPYADPKWGPLCGPHFSQSSFWKSKKRKCNLPERRPSAANAPQAECDLQVACQDEGRAALETFASILQRGHSTQLLWV